MSYAVFDFTIEQGTDFQLEAVIKDELGVPINTAGMSGEAKLRKTAKDAGYKSFTVSFPAPSTSGKVLIKMAKAVTSSVTCGAEITDEESQYVWALKLTDAQGNTTRPLQGAVSVSVDIAR